MRASYLLYHTYHIRIFGKYSRHMTKNKIRINTEIIQFWLLLVPLTSQIADRRSVLSTLPYIVRGPLVVGLHHGICLRRAAGAELVRNRFDPLTLDLVEQGPRVA